VFLIIFHVFSSTKSENKEEGGGIVEGVVRDEGAQTLYTYISKCKNNKIKGERKQNSGKHT
jgi:hypothetical protein